MEYFALFDEHDRPLNQSKPRPDVHRDGDWHRAAQVFVRNEKGELLCHRRHPDKDLHAGLWDLCVAGHVGIDESYLACALRELTEEIGVSPSASELLFLFCRPVLGFDEARQLFDREHTAAFLWQTRYPVPSFQAQPSEITELAYISIPEIRHDLRSACPTRPFIALPDYYEAVLDQIEKLTVPSN